MTRISLTIVCLIMTSMLWAQNYDFGKVSKEELNEKFNPLDSTADASILYRKERVFFTYSGNLGFVQHRQIQMRVKIYNKDGFDWANEKVYLYNGGKGNRESLRGLKGTTYNLESGKITKDKLSSSAVFKEQTSENIIAQSFTLPNIKEGSVVEYKYEISSEFAVLDDFYLQFEVPVRMLEISIETPQFYSYKKLFNPRAYFTPKFTELVKDRTDYNDNVITIREQNIKALKAESFAGNIGNYRAKLSMELNAILTSFGAVEKSFASNWEKVSQTIYESNSFGGQLRRSGFFRDDLEPLLVGVEDDFAKAAIVETLVKSKVKWNGNYGKYAQKGIKEAYTEGAGNSGDINLLVVAMLQSVGVNAAPVLVSTSNNGIPLFPTRDGFNYVIAMVKGDNGYMLIDATEPYSVNSVLPKRVLNWQGRAVYKDKTSDWIPLSPNQKSQLSSMMNVKITDDMIVEGSMMQNYTNHIALNYRQTSANLSEESHLKNIESGKGDIEVSNLKMENSEDPWKPLKLSYSYELMDGVDEVGSQVYFNPLLFLANEENPFKLEERKYPIDFVYPAEEKYKINIMLPEGYKVESLPKSEAYTFKDSAVKFVYRMRANGQYLQLSVDFQINSAVIQPSDYNEFKQFYSKVVEKQQDQVVLSKT